MDSDSIELDRQESVLIMHLLDGEPQGPRILEITHTNTKAIAVPRTSYERVSRSHEEFRRPGVYILVFDPSSVGASERIYIGQADVARIRLDQHAKDPEKDWIWCVLFTSRDGRMNNAHAQFLESRLVSTARLLGRAELVNGNSPQEPTLDPADRAMARRFLADILIYCPILGLNAFTSPKITGGALPSTTSESGITAKPSGTATTMLGSAHNTVYHLESLPEARGYNSDDGFVVMQGSPLRPHISESANTRAGVGLIRETLRQRGVLDSTGESFRFNRDHLFNSPSQAAMVLLGYPISGRTAWLTVDGRTLNDVESGELSQGPAAIDRETPG